MGTWVWPVPSCTTISSGFGTRSAPTAGASTNHMGIDIPGVRGAFIYAARPGKVTRVAYNSTRGNFLEITHDGGYLTRYQHLVTAPAVDVDQIVAAGQFIGQVGSSGVATGPHLHFELMYGASYLDPAKYISPEDTIKSYQSNVVGTKPISYYGRSHSESVKESMTGLDFNVPYTQSIVTDNGILTTTTYGPASSSSVEITKVVNKYSLGKTSSYKYGTVLRDYKSVANTGAELLIMNGDTIFMPCIEGDLKYESKRKNSPGKMTFTVVQDKVLKVVEGNPVRFRYDGKNVFYGYIFEKSRKNKDLVTITAYDQIRYLKYKDSFAYSNKKYSDLLKMICNAHHLAMGTICDTEYTLDPEVAEDTLLDILMNASDYTTLNTGKLYVLYDDFGKLCLKNCQDMMVNIVIDEESGESYEYTSTIDKDVYNKIVLARDNDETGERELYTITAEQNTAAWGELQYYESSDSDPETLKAKLKQLLKYYNQKRRKLTLKGLIGDTRVRGGSYIMVMFKFDDIKLQNFMLVEEVTHKFSNGRHSMDLKVVSGRGDFVA